MHTRILCKDVGGVRGNITDTQASSRALAIPAPGEVEGATVLWKERTFSLDRRTNPLSGTASLIQPTGSE